MKKVLLFAACTVLVLGLTACQKQDDVGFQSEADPSEMLFFDNNKELPSMGTTYNYPFTDGVLFDWNVPEDGAHGILSKNGTFTTSGQDGLALFGPYAQCSKGVYDFVLSYTVVANPNKADIVGVFDICTNDGKVVVAQVNLEASQRNAELENITFADTTALLEHRVWTTNGATLNIASITITRTDVEPDPNNDTDGAYADVSYGYDNDNSLPASGVTYNYPYTFGVCLNWQNTAPNGRLQQDGSYVVSGDGGLAMYGPYGQCENGKYDFTLSYEVIENPDSAVVVGRFDVCMVNGIQVLDESTLVADKQSVTLKGIEFPNYQGNVFEHRVWTANNAKIRIISVEIERQDK